MSANPRERFERESQNELEVGLDRLKSKVVQTGQDECKSKAKIISK